MKKKKYLSVQQEALDKKLADPEMETFSQQYYHLKALKELYERLQHLRVLADSLVQFTLDNK